MNRKNVFVASLVSIVLLLGLGIGVYTYPWQPDPIPAHEANPTPQSPAENWPFLIQDSELLNVDMSEWEVFVNHKYNYSVRHPQDLQVSIGEMGALNAENSSIVTIGGLGFNVLHEDALTIPLYKYVEVQRQVAIDEFSADSALKDEMGDLYTTSIDHRTAYGFFSPLEGWSYFLDTDNGRMMMTVGIYLRSQEEVRTAHAMLSTFDFAL